MHNTMKRARASRSKAIAFALCMTSLPAASFAQTAQNDWQFRAILYGYFPDIGGKTTFATGEGTGTGAGINIDSSNIIGNLKFAYMGTLEVQKGAWGAFSDIMYLNVSGSKSQTGSLSIRDIRIPAGITADASLDVKGWVWTAAAEYRVVGTPETTFDVFAGVRLLDVKQHLDYEFSASFGPFEGPGREGSSDAKVNNWDGIVGVKGRVAFGPQRAWFIPYYVDIGTGDSDFTWQGIAGIGYSFGTVELIAAWRYLDYDFKSNKAIESLNFNGPAVGVAFRW